MLWATQPLQQELASPFNIVCPVCLHVCCEARFCNRSVLAGMFACLLIVSHRTIISSRIAIYNSQDAMVRNLFTLHFIPLSTQDWTLSVVHLQQATPEINNTSLMWSAGLFLVRTRNGRKLRTKKHVVQCYQFLLHWLLEQAWPRAPANALLIVAIQLVPQVTGLQLFGYLVSMSGFVCYNYIKTWQVQPKQHALLNGKVH